MKKVFLLAAALGASLSAGAAHAQTARDYISIAGSSTVFPFSTAVAEQFGRVHRNFRTPKVESTGTGGGIRLFCNGIGPATVDVANASRRMKDTEFRLCQQNNVRDVVEIKIGYDGIVVASARNAPHFDLTRRELFLALAKEVPDPKNPSRLIANPHRNWNQINPKFPDQRIEVLGPPPTSGTRDAFLELAMEPGCASFDSLKAIQAQDERRFRAVCHSIREDGAYVDAGENDNLIVQKLLTNPRALGIFGYSFLEENANRISAARIEGVEPAFEAIASGKYPVARSMYIYVKKAHIGVIPGLAEFVAEFVSDRAMGREGYLTDRGLIPLPAPELAKVRATAKQMEPMRL